MSSEGYVVSARKYRPSTFEEVVGQRALTNTLKNAITTGRLAQAYLFCGPRGVGKTSCARIFAKTINCSNRTPQGEACGQCESCREFQRGNSYNVIELDAASNNGVDQMRALTDRVNVPPAPGTYRIFIIDEVHMLSSSAFNAFLKTLEEPPSYVVFILATTEKNKVIPTILSRCQIYDFARITNADIAEHLSYVASHEGVEAEPMALDVIAQKSDGAMRDALSIFDQIAASSGGKITYQATIDNLNVLDYDYYFRFMEAFCIGDVPAVLLLYKEVRDKGFDARFFVNGMAQHIRNLLVGCMEQTVKLLQVGWQVQQRYLEQSRQFKPRWYYAALGLLSDCDLNMRNVSDPQLHVELTLIRLCQLNSSDDTTGGNTGMHKPMHTIAATPVQTQSGVQTVATTAAAVSAVIPTAPAAAKTPVAPSPQVVKPQVTPVTFAARPMDKAHRSTTRARVGASLRLKENLQSDATEGVAVDEPEPARSATEQHRNMPVTEKNLMQAWNEYILQRPQKHILINAMRNIIPTIDADERLNITVPNTVLQQEMESNSKDLCDFLHDKLHNYNITLLCKVDTTQRGMRMLDEGELLREIVKENPTIGEFLRKVDAERD